MNEKRLALVAGSDKIRAVMTGYVRDFFEIVSTSAGPEALEAANTCAVSLSIIFIGVSTQQSKGIALIRSLNENGLIRRIPVIVFSLRSDPEVERYAYEMGVAEYITLPFNTDTVQIKLRNIMGLYRYKDELEEKSERLLREAMENHENTIDFLANVIEARNMENGEHVSRVKGFTRILAEQVMTDYPELGLDEDQVSLISSASALHDLGKIMIRESVLLKPGKLTEEESEYVKNHTVYGCILMNKLKKMMHEDFYRLSYEICRYHHEKVDGSGYPEGLVGDEIPLAAQIVSVADCYDALTAVRPYKPAYPPEVAYRMILDGECGAFAERILGSFTRCKSRILRMTAQYAASTE